MKNNNPLLSILLPVIISVAVVAGITIGRMLPPMPSAVQQISSKSRSDKINTILNIIEANYVDTVNKAQLVDNTISAILRRLDPHSVYIPAKDLARANEPLRGSFEGIGISFNMMTDTILVISALPGGPSEKLGMLPGDKIIYINDSLVAGKRVSEDAVIGMLKGPKGTTVSVKILRSGHNELIPFDITRDKIPIYSVDVDYMVNENTGYIKINSFAVTTYDEFMKSMKNLSSQGMEKLIFDLRGNSGGIMEAAIRIANEFLEIGRAHV